MKTDLAKFEEIFDLTTAISVFIRRYPSAIQQESSLSELIERSLKEMKIEHKKEFRLTPNSRLDFLLENGICIELKKGSAGLKELRQVGRYLEHDDVRGAIIIAMRCKDIPAVFLGKPILCLELWKMLL